jgi:hypothetical protein
MKFEGDIIITDPCYIIPESKDDDWDKSDYGNDFTDILGTNNYLSKDTGVGDWSNEIINTDDKMKIGKFCADAGMVAVFNLSDVLKYNPDFNYHISRQWTTALIKDFKGEINIEFNEADTAVITGTGNINFKSNFIGF